MLTAITQEQNVIEIAILARMFEFPMCRTDWISGSLDIEIQFMNDFYKISRRCDDLGINKQMVWL